MSDLSSIIDAAVAEFTSFDTEDWQHKKNPDKWSRKEILGHLIDSAINNLQRFTEVQYEKQPLKIRKYNQDELVKVNDYQNLPIKQIFQLWTSINKQISSIIKSQTAATLALQVETSPGEIKSLGWLMEDYIEHLEHHLNQIRNY